MSRGPGGWLRVLVATCVPATVVYLVLSGGLLPTEVDLAVPVLLLLLTPTSPALARRIATNGLLLMASLPTLWWVRTPVPVHHAAAFCALATAALGAWVACGAGWSRLHVLRPTTAPSDAYIVLAGLWAVLATQRWETARSPQQVLSFLYRGYDNVAHFDIVSMMLRHGSMLDVGGGSAGDRMSLRYYPQGYHAMAASFIELTAPHTLAGPPALVAYAHAVAGLVALGTVVLVSAAMALPGLRDRPLLAAPVVVVLATAFLWEPGGKVLLDGFANFWWGAAACATGLVLGVDPPRRFSAAHWSAVASALVVAANAWAPLVILGAPAVAMSASLVARPRTTRERGAAVLVSAFLAAGLLRPAWMLARSVDMNAIVTAAGAITNPSPTPTLLLVVLSTLLFLGFGPLAGRLGRDDLLDVCTTVRRTVLMTAAGASSLTVLAVLQLHSLHGLSYYFLKYLIGFELVLAATAVAVAGMCAALVLPAARAGRSRVLAVAVVLVGCALLTQAFGPVGWRSALNSPEPRRISDQAGAPLSDDAIAAGVLRASRGLAPSAAAGSEYLALGPSRAFSPILPATWFHSLDGGLTTTQQARLEELDKPSVGVPSAARIAERVLRRDPRARIVVAPQYLAAVRAAVRDPRLVRRVTTWSASVQAQGER